MRNSGDWLFVIGVAVMFLPVVIAIVRLAVLELIRSIWNEGGWMRIALVVTLAGIILMIGGACLSQSLLPPH